MAIWSSGHLFQEGTSTMRVISLANAKAQLSALLDDVEAGRQVVITRRGRRVARLVAEQVPRKRAATAWVAGLRSFVESQPLAEVTSVVALRGEERY
jgi:prevent-host-death family protein